MCRQIVRETHNPSETSTIWGIYISERSKPPCLPPAGETCLDVADPRCLKTALPHILGIFLFAAILDLLPGVQYSAEAGSNSDWWAKPQTVQCGSTNLLANPADAQASLQPALTQFPSCFQILMQTTEILLGLWSKHSGWFLSYYTQLG